MALDPKKVFHGDGLDLLALIALDMPKVATRAMNNMAWAARTEVRDSLEKNFILRGNKRMKNGIRTKNGNFAAGVSAMVYTLDDWAAQHEEGGVKTSTAGHRIAIPITKGQRGPHGIRNDVRTVLRGKGRPRPLRDKNHEVGVFPGLGKFHNTPTAFIFRRRKLKVKSKKTGETITKERLEYLYFMVPQTKIKPRLGMHDTVLRVVKEQSNEFLNKALDDHLNRRRRK